MRAAGRWPPRGPLLSVGNVVPLHLRARQGGVLELLPTLLGRCRSGFSERGPAGRTFDSVHVYQEPFLTSRPDPFDSVHVYAQEHTSVTNLKE